MPFRVAPGLVYFAILSLAVSGQDEPQGSGSEIMVKLGNPFALRYEVAIESLVDYRIRSEAAERSEEQVRMILKEEYGQVTADGRTQIRCNRRSIESGRGGLVNTAETGRTFEIIGSGEDRRVRATDGKEVDPAFADHLGRWTDLLALVPNKAVLPGDSWKVEVANLDKAITLGRPVSGLSFTCVLQGVQDRVATITFKVSQKQEGKGGEQQEIEEEWSLNLEFSGVVQVDTATDRPKEVQVRGRFSLVTMLFKNERDLESRLPVRKEIGRITVEADRVISTVKFSYPD